MVSKAYNIGPHSQISFHGHNAAPERNVGLTTLSRQSKIKNSSCFVITPREVGTKRE